MVHTIEARPVNLYGQSIPMPRIDGMPLNQLVAELARDKTYWDLWPAWLPLENEREQRYIRTLLEEYWNCNLPILVCPDDVDLSCAVIVAKVYHAQEFVRWERIGTEIRENWDWQVWRRSGIRRLDTWSDEDWKKYGEEVAWWEPEDSAWDALCSQHWPEEELRRIWNYHHPYLNDDANILWFPCEPLTFNKVRYKECVDAFLLMEE